jgi:hypothetical protein
MFKLFISRIIDWTLKFNVNSNQYIIPADTIKNRITVFQRGLFFFNQFCNDNIFERNMILLSLVLIKNVIII